MELDVKLEVEGYDPQKVREAIARILESNKLLSMASIKDGESYINTAYFCFDRLLNILTLNDPSSQHVANIAKNPSVALAIYDSSQPIDSKRQGLQIFGNCTRAEGELAEAGLQLYFDRFPAFKQWLQLSGKEISEAEKMVYVTRPTWLKLYDEPDFGHVFIPVKIEQ
ncbi:MAG: pyridoxamine 5'-phosphate oxidase family protein [Candidatus Micrarchaeia archaeon]